jgi:hypothetical protein
MRAGIGPVMPRSAPLAFALPNWASWMLVVVLVSHVLDSPVRWVLSFAHLEALVYLRDAFALAVFAAAIIHWMNGGQAAPALVIAMFMLPHLFWGMLMQPHIVQPLFGLKMYVTFLLGACCLADFRRHEQRWMQVLAGMFWITALGVAINKFMPMPWAGMLISSAAGDVAVSREWSMAGIQRLAGFTRASYDASAILAMMGGVVMLNSKRAWQQLVVFVIAFVLITLTTSKGSVLAWIVMGMAVPLLPQRQYGPLLTRLMWLAPALVLGIPALLAAYEYRADVSGPLGWLLSSFLERINQMWPDAFSNAVHHGNIILGRGIGGIGFAQRFGDMDLYNSADNVMVYLYVTFGVPAVIYVYYMVSKFAAARDVMNEKTWQCAYLWLLYWFVYGLTGNNIEAPFPQFFIGLIFAASILAKRPVTPKRSNP